MQKKIDEHIFKSAFFKKPEEGRDAREHARACVIFTAPRAPHAHDVTDVSSCLFWIVGKRGARAHLDTEIISQVNEPRTRFVLSRVGSVTGARGGLAARTERVGELAGEGGKTGPVSF